MPYSLLSKLRKHALTSFAKIGIVVVVLAVAGIASVFYVTRATSTTTSSVAEVTITSVDGQWNGQTYALVSSSYYNTLPDRPPGVDIAFEFTNNGEGFSPNQTFSVTTQSIGFNVVWVQFCIVHSPGSTSPQSCPSSSMSTGYFQYNSAPSCGGCAEDGNNVQMFNVSPDSTIYVLFEVQFPTSAYDGPLTLLISPS